MHADIWSGHALSPSALRVKLMPATLFEPRRMPFMSILDGDPSVGWSWRPALPVRAKYLCPVYASDMSQLSRHRREKKWSA